MGKTRRSALLDALHIPSSALRTALVYQLGYT